MGPSASKETKQLASDSSFSSSELKRLRKIFKEAKRDKKSTELTLDEFKAVFEKCTGREVEQGGAGVDLEEIFASVDTDHSGTVSFQELIIWLSIYAKGSDEDRLTHMFRAFDEDGNGVLEASEINHVLDILKLSMTSQGVTESNAIKNAARTVKALDRDKDGQITLQEWIQLGKDTNLVEELLGPQFLDLMSDFNIGRK